MFNSKLVVSICVLSAAVAVTGCNMDSSFSDLRSSRSAQPNSLGAPVDGEVAASGVSGVTGGTGVEAPLPPVNNASCGAQQMLYTATFKCHSSGSRQPDRIHCNFRVSELGDHIEISSQFVPSSVVVAESCAAVQSGSLIAKIQDIAPVNGEVHFDGTISACANRVSVLTCKDKKALKSVLELAFLKEMGKSSGNVKVSSVRKGRDQIVLGAGSSVKAANYCLRSEHDEDEDTLDRDVEDENDNDNDNDNDGRSCKGAESGVGAGTGTSVGQRT